MSGRAMRMEFMNAEFCRNNPSTYKLCTIAICVHRDTPCPCQHGVEFRCPDGQCIPSTAQCDGTRHCSRGEDEISCPGRVVTSPDDGLSLHVILAIVSVCLIVCVASLIVLGYFFLRRRKTNTSRESQSATEPLKTKYPSPVVDSSESYDEPGKSSKRDYVYHQMYDASRDFENELDTQLCKATREHKEKVVEQPKNKTFLPNICTIRTMKIYDFDREANESFGGCEMGKYIFKPRLKGANVRNGIANSQTNGMTNSQTSGVHEIVHSYKHAHDGQGLLPTTFNFDLDPDNVCSTFATELLCSSTPRQPSRRLVAHSVYQSHDSLVDDVTVVNEMTDTDKDLQESETKEFNHKVDSETTNTVDTNTILSSVECLEHGLNISGISEDLDNEVF